MKTRKPRIAILGPFPPSTGGICTNLLSLLNSPLKGRYSFLPFQTGSLKYGNPWYFDEKFYMKFYRAVKNLFIYLIFLSKYSPDIVHINTSFSRYSFWRDSLYLLIAKLLRRKIILQIHGGRLDEFWQKKSLLLRKLAKKTLEISDQILVLSVIQKRPFEHLDIKQRIRVVPNMIDADKFNGDSNYRKSLHIPKDYIVVLFVAAHFFKEKGVWEVLEAVPHVVTVQKNIIFVLVGGGKEEEAMRNFCEERKLQEYIRFTEHLHGKELVKTFLASDIFILPSYNEGFPLTILEAMAVGLPVVATSVGAIPEIIEDGVNGFLIQPKDSLALANKIKQLAENNVLRKSMGKNNEIKIREKYDLKSVAKIFDEIYTELLSR